MSLHGWCADQLQDEAENKACKYALALDIILCLCPKGQDVQGNACSALVAIVKPTPKSAAQMVSVGVVGLIKGAMEAHLPLMAPGGM